MTFQREEASNMTIRYQCVECDAAMKIKDEKAGTVGHCPKCKAEFIVPSPNDDESAEYKVEEIPESKSESDVVTASTEPKAAHKEKDDEVAARPAKTPEEIAEDEYQAILMGDNLPKEKGSRVAQFDSDPDDSPRSETTPSAVVERTPPKPKAKSTAEISAAMMGKGSSSEPVMKKTGKAFGEGNTETSGVRAKALAQARVYYMRQLLIGGAGVAVIVLGMYWLIMSSMRGAKLPPLGRVSGVVTVDGKPLVGGSVAFQPMAEAGQAFTKANSVAGSMAITDKDGKFTLQYVDGVQGAVIGKHSVQITGTDEFGVSIVPAKYNFSTELTFEVKAGTNPPAKFDLKSK